MALGKNGSAGVARQERTRLARLTAALYLGRLNAQKPPGHVRPTALDLIRRSRILDAGRVADAPQTRAGTDKVGQNGGVSVVPAFAARKSASRMPIHELLAWTLLDGHLALLSEIPTGMAVNLILKGFKSEWQLVRGSSPRDEVLRGV